MTDVAEIAAGLTEKQREEVALTLFNNMRRLVGKPPKAALDGDRAVWLQDADAILPIIARERAAALSAATPGIEARVREACAVIAYEEADCGGPEVCKVQRLKDGTCLNSINGECGRYNAESVAAAIRKG